MSKLSENIFNITVFKAWSFGADETRVHFTDVSEIKKFNKLGIYLGFIQHSKKETYLEEKDEGPIAIFLRDINNFKMASQFEMLQNGYVGETLHLGCTVFWFTDALMLKPELKFLPKPYTIMEYKIKDYVQEKQLEPELV